MWYIIRLILEIRCNFYVDLSYNVVYEYYNMVICIYIVYVNIDKIYIFEYLSCFVLYFL